MGQVQHVTDRREDVHVRDHRVGGAAADLRMADEQRDARSGVGEGAFHLREGDAVVGRVDHDGIFAQAQGIHLIEQRAQQLVRRAQAGQVVAEVVPRLGRVDDGRRREHEVLLDVVVFLIDQVRAVHAEGQEERLVAVAPAAQEVERVGK